MADRKSLRLSATLLLVGVLLSFLAGIFHPDRENANNHPVAFAEYANSGNWTAVHLGQFVGMAVIIAGLLVLFFALNVHSGMPGWAGRFGAVSADWVCPAAVFHDFDHACHAGRNRSGARDPDAVARSEKALRQAPIHCTVDVSDLDVRVRNRRARLRFAVSAHLASLRARRYLAPSPQTPALGGILTKLEPFRGVSS